MRKNKNKVAVITGASKGIGRATALMIAKQGYDIAIFDVLEKQGETLVQEIEKLGQKAMYMSIDVSIESDVLNGVKCVEKILGVPSVLINNAGVFPRGSALEMPFEAWINTIKINLGGTFLCSRAFAPGMLKQGSGVIVNVSSGRGLQGTKRGSHYAASKAGIISLTRSLALEWAPKIRVNTVIPGVTDTDQPREDTNEDELYARGNNIPSGRIGQPDDIAQAIVFLITSEADYITGQSLCVNGGAIMQ